MLLLLAVSEVTYLASAVCNRSFDLDGTTGVPGNRAPDYLDLCTCMHYTVTRLTPRQMCYVNAQTALQSPSLSIASSLWPWSLSRSFELTLVEMFPIYNFVAWRHTF